jgi:predicted metal-binding membrane protein
MLAAAFTQQAGGAVGMNIAAGLGGHVFVPHVTGALTAAVPAAPIVVPTLAAPVPAWMTGVISIWLLPSPAPLPQPRAA